MTLRKGASILAPTLLLAGCGGAQNPGSALDEKVAAAEKAAERAEKAQKAAEDALRSMAGNGAAVSYDAAVDEMEAATRNENDGESTVAQSGGDDQGGGGSHVNSDGVEELTTPPG